MDNLKIALTSKRVWVLVGSTVLIVLNGIYKFIDLSSLLAFVGIAGSYILGESYNPAKAQNIAKEISDLLAAIKAAKGAATTTVTK